MNNDEMLDILKLSAFVNVQAKEINQNIVDGGEKLGMKRIIPNAGVEPRRDIGLPTITSQIPPPAPLIPMDNIIPQQQPQPQPQQQPPIDIENKNQLEFGFAEQLKLTKSSENILLDISKSLSNIEYNLSIYNKNIKEILDLLIKRKKRKIEMA